MFDLTLASNGSLTLTLYALSLALLLLGLVPLLRLLTGLPALKAAEGKLKGDGLPLSGAALLLLPLLGLLLLLSLLLL